MSWMNGMLDERMEEQRKKKLRPPPPPDEEVEEELERPAFVPLNKSRSVFDTAQGRHTEGINTQPSVFDSQAVFHTRDG